MPNEPLIIIPAYKPDDKLIELVNQLQSQFSSRLIIVDDGGGEAFQDIFNTILARHGHCVDLLIHPVNRGKGAALKTAFAHVLHNYGDHSGVVTADADFQHRPVDIQRVCQALEANPRALALGSRDFKEPGIPARSRIGNRITSWVFKLRTGQPCGDTQTGLRGIPMKLLPLCMHLPGDRYEFEMNVLLATAISGISIVPVPIKTIYIEDNRSSHFKVWRDPFLIYKNILMFRNPQWPKSKRKPAASTSPRCSAPKARRD